MTTMSGQTNGAVARPAGYALAKRDSFAPVVFTPTNLEEVYKVADRLAQSTVIPTSLRGKPGDVAVVLMTGLELGLSPMQSLRSIHVIEGRPTLEAALIVARVLADERCEYFTLVESTATVARYEAKRVGSPKAVSMAYTIEQAARARLTGKQNWQGYAEAMLRARCSAALARAVFPDVVLGIYAEEEFDPEPRDVTPPRAEAEPPKARKAKKETPAEPAPVAEPALEPEPSASPVPEATSGVVYDGPAAELLARLAEVDSAEALTAVTPAVTEAKSALPPADYEAVREAYYVRRYVVTGKRPTAGVLPPEADELRAEWVAAHAGEVA